jgi:Transposase DDE domain
VKRRDDVKGFHILPHRWLVERTFGWIGRHRLFGREHEATIASSRTNIHLAMTHIMLRKHKQKSKPEHKNENLLAHAPDLPDTL